MPLGMGLRGFDRDERSFFSFFFPFFPLLGPGSGLVAFTMLAVYICLCVLILLLAPGSMRGSKRDMVAETDVP